MPGDALRKTSATDNTVSRFEPAWWLPGGHCQTLWPALARPRPKVPVRRQYVTLPDDDCVSLVWGPHQHGPVVLILHGLGGCASSPYALGMLRVLSQNALQGIVMEYRGVGSPPSRGGPLYHAGAWQDLRAVVHQLRRILPERPIAVVGFSLGASILLNWLVADSNAPVAAAVAISTPLDLATCAQALNRRSARIYQWDLLRHLKRLVLARFPKLETAPIPIPPMHTIHSLRAFDERITAPLHGYIDAADCYQRCSCGPHLEGIKHNTLMIHAKDDPFVPPPTLTRVHLSPAVQLEITPGGSHVGFVEGRWPWTPEYWLERRVIAYLLGALSTTG